MNIIFEGISGSGKTTIIEQLIKDLSKLNINIAFVPDLTYDTPLKEILLKLVDNSLFMEYDVDFKTSLFESLLLAANHHYTQEKLRDNNNITIFDRDFISVLSMQKEIIKSQYSNWEDFYNYFKKIMLFDLKKIDYLFYVDTPLEVCLKRVKQRDNRNLDLNEIEMLRKIKDNMEENCREYSTNYNIDFTTIYGENSIENNVEVIKRKILNKR